jgi:adenylate kinase family enzyme
MLKEQAMKIKNFKILTLGASGSGKTVFLASLFKELSIQKASTFKLVVRDTKQRKLLNSIYTQIITEDTWPSGTRNISEWTFDCCVQTEELEDYTACQFTYFDYAGGRLIDGEDQKLEEAIEQADAILGLLDGRKIHAWLTGGDQILVNEFLDRDLPSIFKRIQTSKAPIHFVISKWDLLDRDGYNLTKVKEHLLEIPKFAKLLEARSRLGSPVRLIPISAVGLEFASLQPDGSMKKNPGILPMPFLVESPLACILPDKFQLLVEESKAKEETIEKKSQKNSNYLKMLSAGLNAIQSFTIIANVVLDDDTPELVKTLKNTINAASFVNKVLLGKVPGLSGVITNITQNRTAKTLQLVKNEQSALVHAIAVFYDFVQELEERFGHSKLV